MLICDFTQFYSPVGGGVRRYLHEKRQFIDKFKSNLQHLLIVPGDRTLFYRESDRLFTLKIGAPRIDPTSRYRILLNLPELRKALREYQPRIIECGDPYHAAWAVLEEANDIHAACVGFYHSHFPDAYLRTTAKFIGNCARDFLLDCAKHYIQRLYNKFHMTLTPSSHLCEVLTKWGVQRTKVLTLGVNEEVFHYGPVDFDVRSKLGIDPKRIFLLHVGRLSREKNITTLLEAHKILHKEHSGCFHLHVVGDGPLRAQVTAAIHEIGNGLSWQAYIDDARQLAALYRCADIFVHPGVHETFGLVTVEAQACGLPVCGIRGTFMDEIILAHIDLWACRNTPRELASAVLRFASIKNSINRKELASEAVKRFSWKKVFTKLLSYYNEALE